MSNTPTRRIDVPFYRMLSEGYCGLASLQMVFEYWGRIQTQEEIAQHLKPTRAGIERDALEGFARGTGLNVLRKRDLAFDDLILLLERDVPPILLGHRHAFVVTGHRVDDETMAPIYIHDPSSEQGHSDVSIRTLHLMWQHRRGEKDETDALIIYR